MRRSGKQYMFDIRTDSMKLFGVYRLADGGFAGAGRAPDEDQGFRAGYFRPELDDSAWRVISQPAWDGPDDENAYVWTRTKMTLPAEAKDKPLSLTVGGFSLFDYRYLRAFVNGHEVGVATLPGRWREPLTVDLGPGGKGHEVRAFRWREPDRPSACRMRVCACRAGGTESVEEPFAGHASDLAGDFEQYLKIGRPVVTPKLEVTAKTFKEGARPAKRDLN